MNNDNLKLWNAVEKTDPKHTKKANVKGNNLTSIKPQYQIHQATKVWGSYGSTWGFKNIELDYSLMNTQFYNDKTKGSYPNVEIVGKEMSTVGVVVFKAVFFYPEGEFPAINSMSIFTNNKRSKIDDDFAKKIETDSLTKCLSKLGFSADIFMGRFDDTRYVEQMKEEFKEPIQKQEFKEGGFEKAMDSSAKTIEAVLIKFNLSDEHRFKLAAQLDSLLNCDATESDTH